MNTEISTAEASIDDTTAVSQTPSFMPLYRQIKGLLTNSLITGEWHPGDMIPSEMDLAAQFQVSQGTVRKAIDELAAQGILTRKQGKGTFVTAMMEDEIKVRFLRLNTDSGEKPLTQHKLIKCNLGKASAETAKKLSLKTGAIIIEVKRLLLFSGKPLILDYITLPANEFKGLNAAKIEAYKGSMYRMYEAEYNTRMVRAEEKIKAALADAVILADLDIPLHSPMLCVERIAYTYGNKPMELRVGYYLTDGYHYYNELE